jgi:hypothetical protein
MLGSLIFACMLSTVAILHAVWSGARTRIASYRNA